MHLVEQDAEVKIEKALHQSMSRMICTTQTSSISLTIDSSSRETKAHMLP
jgi:hypothetical protein